ncbi:MAG: ABC transporter permease subunit [Chloroflexota bacterium]
MSDNAQPSQMGSDDVFVLETNDLGGGRPRPINDSLLERFVRTPAFIIASYTVYLLLLIFFWNPIENTLGFVPGGILFALIGILPLVGLTVANATTRQTRTEIPFYRDLLTIQEIIQLAFVALILGTLATLILNLNDNLAESGLTINFNVLARDFGTEVSEGPDPRADWTFLQSIPLVGETLYNIPIFTPDTYFRALAAGFANTLRVVWLSLIFSTILGVALGIGLLSNNWLVRNVSFGWVEIFRNTPLLVQLFFIYNGVIRLFPARPGDALSFPGSIFLSSRGFYYPSVLQTPTSNYFYYPLIAGIIIGIFLWRWRLRVNERTGALSYAFRYFAASTVGLGLIGFIVAFIVGGTPVLFEQPVASGFRFEGGASLSGEYLGLFLGLVFYTSAFIADIVRAGIQSVPKGQVEASRALGLKNFQTLNYIILPQALRLAVPPLINQYLNLAKNSSLGIAIGFADLYTVANIANNQSGQTVVMFVLLMVTYLGLSLVISAIMNAFNSTLRLQTR